MERRSEARGDKRRVTAKEKSLGRLGNSFWAGIRFLMGESENIIVRERIQGVFGADEGRYRIAGDNGEECESKRRLKGEKSRTDEITRRLWRRELEKHRYRRNVLKQQRQSDWLPVKTLQKRKQDRSKTRKRSRRGK